MALDAAGWAGLTYKVLKMAPDMMLVFIAFGFTWLFYTRDRVGISDSDRLNNPERTAWYAARGHWLKPAMWVVSGLLLICLCLRSAIVFPAMIGIVPCLLYTRKLRFWNRTFTLKSLPGMKAVLVAFLWVVLTVAFPVATLKIPMSASIVHLCLMVGCFVMLQINTNDLRDIAGDANEGVKSFAVLLGDRKARFLGAVLGILGIFFGWALFDHWALSGFGIFLIARTFLYNRNHDIYWQALISLQGFIAYFVL